MTIHTESHPDRNKTVPVRFTGGHPQLEGDADRVFDFVIEDWWDVLTGGSWMDAEGNPAALIYAMRTGMSGNFETMLDDEVVYGKIGSLGHLVHVSEILPVGDHVPSVFDQDAPDGTVETDFDPEPYIDSEYRDVRLAISKVAFRAPETIIWAPREGYIQDREAYNV